jgi:hypothetical protein
MLPTTIRRLATTLSDAISSFLSLTVSVTSAEYLADVARVVLVASEVRWDQGDKL